MVGVDASSNPVLVSKQNVDVDDPAIDTFCDLDKMGLIDIVIMEGVGCEKFAEHAFHEADKIVREKTHNRCYCVSVEVREHGANSAIFKRDLNQWVKASIIHI